MQNETKFRSILQYLRQTKERQRLDPADTLGAITYIAHVEHLLLELENAMVLNRLQAYNIRAYIEQPARYTPPPEAVHVR